MSFSIAKLNLNQRQEVDSFDFLTALIAHNVN